MRILSIHPCGISRVLLHAVKSYDMGPSRFTSHPRGRCSALYSIIQIDRCFRGVYCFHHQGDDPSCIFIRVCKVQHPGRQSPSYSPCENQKPQGIEAWYDVRAGEGGIIEYTEAVSSSETSFSTYQITRCNIPEDSHLQLKPLFTCRMT
jgi:hypothetical protein